QDRSRNPGGLGAGIHERITHLSARAGLQRVLDFEVDPEGSHRVRHSTLPLVPVTYHNRFAWVRKPRLAITYCLLPSRDLLDTGRVAWTPGAPSVALPLEHASYAALAPEAPPDSG